MNRESSVIRVSELVLLTLVGRANTHLRAGVMQLRRWSKMHMLLQSAVFIVEPALVICRAANIFD